MSRYRKIEVRTWSDEKFRQLSPMQPSGQALWFFLLTGPHTGPIPGLFRAGRAALAEDLGWDLEAFDKAFEEVFAKGMAKADFKARLVWLPNALKHNKPESPNVVRSWRTELDLLPECTLRSEAIAHITKIIDHIGPAHAQALREALGEAGAVPSPKPLAKPSAKASRKTIPNQQQQQEQQEIQSSIEDLSPAKPATLPVCPHEDVIALYGKHLPTLPQPRIWNGVRQRNLAARWRWLLTTKKADGTRMAIDAKAALEFFDRFFVHVGKSDLLMGRARQWSCDLGWLVKEENFAKVIEGNYDNRMPS